MRSVGWIVVAMLVGCHGDGAPANVKAPEGRVADPAVAVTPRFDWSPPCKVRVTEVATLDDTVLQISYRVDVVARAGGELAVDLTDPVFEEVDGVDYRQRQAELTEQRDNWELLPSMIVAADGAYLRTDGLDATVDAVVAQMRLSADEEAALRAYMQQPGVKAGFEASLTKYWAAWVGRWLNWPVAVDTTDDRELDLGPSLGASFPVIAREQLEHLGISGGVAHLRAVRTIDGEAFTAMGRATAAQGPIPPDVAARMRQTGSQVATFEVEIELASLRPRRAIQRTSMHSVISDSAASKTLDHDEQRVMTFDWDHAEGCGR